MGVTNPPAGGKPVGSELGKVLRIIIGVVLLLMGVAGLTFGVAAIFGQELFGWDMVREGWEQLVDEIPFTMPLAGTLFYKLDLVLLYYLPMMGLIYAGIMLIFDLKSPSWRPGLVLFLLWVVVLVILLCRFISCLTYAQRRSTAAGSASPPIRQMQVTSPA